MSVHAVPLRRLAVGGPLPGFLAAILVLLVQLGAVRWGLGIPGLGSLRELNDDVVAATAPPLLLALLAAAALGAYLTARPGERRAGELSASGEHALVGTMLCCVVVLPLLAGRPLVGAPHSANLILLGLAAEIAVGAGLFLGHAVLRQRVPGAFLVVVVGAAMLPFLVRAVLTHALVADIGGFAAGLDFTETERGLRRLQTWLPFAQGAATAVTVAAAAMLVRAERDEAAPRVLTMAGVAVVPPVLVALSLVLALPGVGTAVADPYGWRYWAGTVAGCVVGWGIGLLGTVVRR